MAILGIGHDVVDVRAFGEQLEMPGSRGRSLFSARELRQARMRAGCKNDGEAVHLAGKWAAKESAVKAWCAALGEVSAPYTLDNTPWSGIEILGDARGVPHVLLQPAVHAELVCSLAHAEGASAAGVPRGAGVSDAVGVDGGDGPSDVSGELTGARTSGASDPVQLRWHLSISHDGPIASAVAVLERAE